MIDPKNLATWLHEKAGPAHDALKADPARAVSADRVRYTPAVGRELLPEDLQTVEAIAAFLAGAEATADPAYIQHAREVAACARAMHGIK